MGDREAARAAWLCMLQECLRHLDCEDPVAGQARWVVERAEAVAKLREVCRRYGDNDWPDDLHLGDVIEKHLWRNIDNLFDTLSNSARGRCRS